MIKRKPRAKRPIITKEQKKIIIDLLIKIIGDTIKGKLARVATAAAVAGAATYLEVDTPPTSAPIEIEIPAK